MILHLDCLYYVVMFIVVETKIKSNGEHIWKALCRESGALLITNLEKA
jgi:hypothetical protein